MNQNQEKRHFSLVLAPKITLERSFEKFFQEEIPPAYADFLAGGLLLAYLTYRFPDARVRELADAEPSKKSKQISVYVVNQTAFVVSGKIDAELAEECASLCSTKFRIYLLVLDRDCVSAKTTIRDSRITVQSIESYISLGIHLSSEFSTEGAREAITEIVRAYNTIADQKNMRFSSQIDLIDTEDAAEIRNELVHG